MKAQSGYIPTLDGWRAIAILGVIISHVINYPYDSIRAGTYHSASAIADFGAGGVEVFFCLSGFLITRRLLEEERVLGAISLPRFYIRLGFRILPAALVYLAITGCLGLFRIIPLAAGEWFSSLFFLRNYYAVSVSAGWYTGHFWSLAIEEHFYLFWPLMLMLVARLRLRMLAAVAVVGIASFV